MKPEKCKQLIEQVKRVEKDLEFSKKFSSENKEYLRNKIWGKVPKIYWK